LSIHNIAHMDWDNLCFNIATSIAGIFVLDYGADKFLDHTVIVGRRLGISPTLIALLTAGAEYEELAVVIAAILQHRTPLALGNVMGSAISNILGAFSLGLLCQPGGMQFDASAKIYSSILLCITTLFVALALADQLNRVTGILLIASFVIYLLSIGYAIYKGVTSAPEMSDSDSDSDSDGDEETSINDEERLSGQNNSTVSESSPLLENTDSRPQDGDSKLPRPLYQHVFHLFVGLLALSISGYILAHSAGAIADDLHLSGTVFGLTVIAFATTLPEKFISVISGFRGQGGVVVATTAGSNIFLLTLCVGVVAISGVPVDGKDTYVLFDLQVLWLSALCFTVVVFTGPSRIAGWGFLIAYITFLALEFTVYRR
ncbi:uncharacterized protein N7483_005301, partial [Penicillium malachiteum]|uniref:uncharacterized protein n=1 Tax=Penicillium malachiteum TaxID=1324776 RepID=UPI002547C686